MSFTQVDGLTLYYAQDGVPSTPPLVFINSLGTDLRIWDGPAALLGKHHSVIRYDKRGHGLSDCPAGPYNIRDHARDLDGLLNYMGIGRVILIGISVGGMIALDFAAIHSDRVHSLVLCDTAPRIGTAEMWNARIAALRQNGMAAHAPDILARWFAPSYREAHPAGYRGYANMLARTPLEGYVATCAAIRDADLTEAARAMDVPALTICGSLDLATPPQLVHDLYESMPNATYREIPGAAHLPCIEQPDIIANHIADFLQESNS